MIRVRGAVMVETALFTSAALVLLLGTLQIGALGFVQLSSDAAGYYDARAHVLGVATTTSAEQDTNLAFPQVPSAAMAASEVQPPAPSIPVDYGWNDPSSSVQSNSVFNRHGGASMLQPASEQVVVNDAPIMKILGQGLGASSIASEPMWEECGTHFDVANTGCSVTPTSDTETNYFKNGEYTPPYMVGLNIIEQCEENQPFGVYTGSNGSQNYFDIKNSQSNYSTNKWADGCSTDGSNGNPDISFLSLGTAEFLDTTNWSDSGTSGSNGAGISGPCDTSGVAAGGSGAGTSQTVFEAIAYHQRTYALLAQYFAANPSQYDLESYSAEWDPTTNTQNQWESNYSAYWTQIFSGAKAGRYAVGTSYAGKVAIPEAFYGSPIDWEGFDDPTDRPGGSSDKYNKAVQAVYSWDVPISSGAPPSDPTYNNPTHPDEGCS